MRDNYLAFVKLVCIRPWLHFMSPRPKSFSLKVRLLTPRSAAPLAREEWPALFCSGGGYGDFSD